MPVIHRHLCCSVSIWIKLSQKHMLQAEKAADYLGDALHSAQFARHTGDSANAVSATITSTFKATPYTELRNLQPGISEDLQDQ